MITGPGVKFLQWFPAEADVSIRPGWFWHPDEQPKTAEQLVDLYHSSVGRNAVLLLNVPPNTSGRVDDADVASLTGFGQAIEDLYRHNLLRGARPTRVAEALTDPHLGSSWSPSAGATTGTLELTLRKASAFDRIRLGENITRGQHVQQFAVDVWTGTAWTTVATGTTIGYARILLLPAPVTADRIRFRVVQSRATPHLSTLGLYLKDPAGVR